MINGKENIKSGIYKSNLSNTKIEFNIVIEDAKGFYGVYKDTLIFSDANKNISGYNIKKDSTVSYGLDGLNVCPCVCDNKCYFFDSTKTFPAGGETRYSVQNGVIDGYDIYSGEKSSTIQNFNGWGPKMTISEDGVLFYTNEGISACAISNVNVEGKVVYGDSNSTTIGSLMGYYILGNRIGVYSVTDTSNGSQTQGQNCNITFNLIDTVSGKGTTL